MEEDYWSNNRRSPILIGQTGWGSGHQESLGFVPADRPVEASIELKLRVRYALLTSTRAEVLPIITQG
jgi:hypothetical protein